MDNRIIVVGVSGGPDSLTLLDLLYRAGYPLIIAHQNHSLRDAADEDTRYVRLIAENLQVPFRQAVNDVAKFAQEHSLTIEEAARKVRYRFLFDVAREVGAQAVAVGHTADDQVETVLMHLLRGTGLTGLKGMAFRARPNTWDPEIPLVRPLLGIWREEILEYCQSHQLKPVHDQTNLDTAFFRNRVRLEILPYLESVAPEFRRKLWRTADLLAGDYSVIEQATDSALRLCGFERRPGCACFEQRQFQSMETGLQRNILRYAISIFRPGLSDIDQETIDRGIQFVVQPPTSCQIEWIGHLSLFLELGKIFILDVGATPPDDLWPQMKDAGLKIFTPPCDLAFENGWEFLARLVPFSDLGELLEQTKKDSFQACLDASRLIFPLELRIRLPGDRFLPMGMAGHSQKLSDIMVNGKIPKRARRFWPLVASNAEIVWVPGSRIAEGYQITPGTRLVLHLCLRNPDVDDKKIW